MKSADITRALELLERLTNAAERIARALERRDNRSAPRTGRLARSANADPADIKFPKGVTKRTKLKNLPRWDESVHYPIMNGLRALGVDTVGKLFDRMAVDEHLWRKYPRLRERLVMFTDVGEKRADDFIEYLKELGFRGGALS